MDERDHANTCMYKRAYFTGLNFVVCSPSAKTTKIGPLKIPAIRYPACSSELNQCGQCAKAFAQWCFIFDQYCTASVLPRILEAH